MDASMANVRVTMTKSPTDDDWMEVKEDALVTVGKRAVTPPTTQWKHKML